MARFKVYLNEDATYEVDVDADTQTDAEEKAEQRFVELGAPSFPVEVHAREASRVEEIAEDAPSATPLVAETSTEDTGPEIKTTGATPDNITEQMHHHIDALDSLTDCSLPIALLRDYVAQIEAGEFTANGAPSQDPARVEARLPDLLAAILRRAERGRSYGKIMVSSKDACLDDVIRLARAAIATHAQA